MYGLRDVYVLKLAHNTLMSLYALHKVSVSCTLTH